MAKPQDGGIKLNGEAQALSEVSTRWSVNMHSPSATYSMQVIMPQFAAQYSSPDPRKMIYLTSLYIQVIQIAALPDRYTSSSHI
jgi:hypothetical protein